MSSDTLETVLYWILRLNRLSKDSELPRSSSQRSSSRPSGLRRSAHSKNVGNRLKDRWLYDYLAPARGYASRYAKATDPAQVLEFAKGLFCLATISHALRYLDMQDRRDELQVTRSSIPLVCYDKMLQLDNWSEMAELLAEMSEHIELASAKEWEGIDLMFAHFFRGFARMIRQASDPKMVREMLELAIK